MKDYLKDREMRAVVRDTFSSWSNATSGVPHASVLALIMSQVYVNDMQCDVTSYMNLFADDTKLLKVVKSHDNWLELQRDIDRIYERSKKWRLEFNAKKCHVMELRKSKRRQEWEYKIGQEVIMKSKEEKILEWLYKIHRAFNGI